MKRLDKNEKELVNGDIIDLHQTVNGQNLFIVLNVETLDVRYIHDLNYKYQYSTFDLLKPDPFHGDTEWEIVGNIYNILKNSLPGFENNKSSYPKEISKDYEEIENIADFIKEKAEYRGWENAVHMATNTFGKDKTFTAIRLIS